MTDQFKQIDAAPYAWPFDGKWNAKDTALLLLGFEAPLIADLQAEAELARACLLAMIAKAAGLAVFASQHGQPTNQAEPVAMTPSGSLAPEIAALAAPELMIHQRDNIFFNASFDVEAMLRKRGIRNLLFAGLPTEGLMHASMRAANDKGFECLAVSDASKGTDMSRHQAQLRITTFGNGLFGVVAPAQPLIDALSGQD